MANILTQVGEDYIVDLIDTGSQFIAWGNPASRPTAVKGDTTLQTEASEARTSATRTQPASDKIRWAGTITCAGAGKVIYEVGVLTLGTGGTLLVHCDFAAVNVAVGDQIAFTIDMEIT